MIIEGIRYRVITQKLLPIDQWESNLKTREYIQDLPLPDTSVLFKLPLKALHHFQDDITHYYFLGFSGFAGLATISHSMELKTITSVFFVSTLSTGVMCGVLAGHSYLKGRLRKPPAIIDGQVVSAYTIPTIESLENETRQL